MSDWLDRVKAERDALQVKLVLMMGLVLRGRPAEISEEHWALLLIQRHAMEAYMAALKARIAMAEREGSFF